MRSLTIVVLAAIVVLSFTAVVSGEFHQIKWKGKSQGEVEKQVESLLNSQKHKVKRGGAGSPPPPPSSSSSSSDSDSDKLFMNNCECLCASARDGLDTKKRGGEKHSSSDEEQFICTCVCTPDFLKKRDHFKMEPESYVCTCLCETEHHATHQFLAPELKCHCECLSIRGVFRLDSRSAYEAYREARSFFSNSDDASRFHARKELDCSCHCTPRENHAPPGHKTVKFNCRCECERVKEKRKDFSEVCACDCFKAEDGILRSVGDPDQFRCVCTCATPIGPVFWGKRSAQKRDFQTENPTFCTCACQIEVAQLPKSPFIDDYLIEIKKTQKKDIDVELGTVPILACDCECVTEFTLRHAGKKSKEYDNRWGGGRSRRVVPTDCSCICLPIYFWQYPWAAGPVAGATPAGATTGVGAAPSNVPITSDVPEPWADWWYSEDRDTYCGCSCLADKFLDEEPISLSSSSSSSTFDSDSMFSSSSSFSDFE